MNESTLLGDHSARRLDRDTIVRAGLEIAARPRIKAISVRTLGSALGVDPTAVYRHFRNKDDLMSALLDELQAAALKRLPADALWHDRLRTLAQATLEIFVERPSIAVEATVLTTNGPAEVATIEFILAAFAEAGLGGEDLVRYYALFASYVLSEAAGIARGRTSSSADDTHSAAWFEGPLLVDPLTHSHIASVAAQLRDLRDDEIFAMGVDLILDSAARAVAESAAAESAAPARAVS